MHDITVIAVIINAVAACVSCLTALWVVHRARQAVRRAEPISDRQ
jgi:hypothetical protein